MVPGEVDVVQADRPYLLEFPEVFSQYVIKLPRGAEPVGQAISPTAARFVRSLARDLLDPDIEPDETCDAVTVRAMHELLCGRSKGRSPARRTPDLYTLALAIMRETIFEPMAGRDRIAKQLGVSVRTLARAFARHGTTFDRSLWDCRLNPPTRCCCRSLDAPASPISPCATDSRMPRTLPDGSRPDLA